MLPRNIGAVVALVFAFPVTVSAWSGAGHEVVCDIAMRELSPAKQQKVKAILARDTSKKFRDFGPACTWPDDKKHTPGTIQNKRRNAHFINVPRDLQAITQDDCGQASMCLFSAIRDDTKVVKTGSGRAQLEALKFLGHWVGDIHQPLHVSFADDSGGGAITVPEQGDDQCPTLHMVWDLCLPDDLMEKKGVNTPEELAAKLQKAITPAERTAWRNSSPVDWAAESYTIGRTPDVEYCTLDAQKQCCYSAAECVHQGANRTLNVGDAYDAAHVDIVEERLRKAGVRLGALLDRNLR
jgi:hypothetical protein